MAVSAINIKANAQEVINLKKRIDELKASLSGMKRQDNVKLYDKLNNELQQSSIRYNRLTSEIQRYVAEQNKASQATSSSANEMLNLFAKIGGTTAFIGLGKQVMDVRNEFQQLEIAFGTMLKSTDKASVLMKDLAKFAAETPFGLQSAASGAKQLLAYGSTADTVIKELTMLGDVAAGTGQQIGDLVYLYGTLRTQGRAYLMDIRQFAGRGIPIYDELAKVLNTSKDKVNDLVSAGKVGFKEVEQAFKNMTAQGGLYGGLMEEQSKSIGGRMEALKDNISSIFNQIGKDSEGFIYKSIDGINTLVENYETVGKVLIGLVATYGTYKAALVVINTLEKANVAIMRQAVVEKNLAAMANIKLTSAEAFQIASKKMLTFHTTNLTKALKAQALAMVTNPAILMTAALVGLGWSVYKLATYESDLTKVHKDASRFQSELTTEIIKESAALDTLFGKLKETTESTDDRKKIVEQLTSRYGEYLGKQNLETANLNQITIAQKEANVALEENIRLKKLNQESENIKNNLTQNIEKYTDKIDALVTDVDNFGVETGTRISVRLQQAIQEAIAKGTTIDRDAFIENIKKDFDKTGDILSNGLIEDLEMSLYSNMQMINRELYNANTGLSLIEKKAKVTLEESQKLNKEASVEPKTPKAIQDQIFSATKSVQDLKNELKGLQDGIIPDASMEDASFDFAKTIEEKTKSLKEAEDKLSYLLYGKSSSGQSKADKAGESAAEKAQKLAQKQADARIKGYNDLERADLDHYNATLENKQNSLNLLEDGFEKEQQLLDINLDKSVLAAQKRVRDLIEKQQQAEEDAWKAGGSKGVFTPSTQSSDDLFKINPGAKTEYNKSLKIAKSTYDKGMSDLYKSQLEMFQDYSAKRVAIEKKFNDNIASLESARAQAEKDGNKELVDQLNRSVAQATKDKGESLVNLDFEQLKKTPEYVRAFENLKNTSTETLNSLLQQLEQSKQAAVQVLTPDQLKEYTSTIESIMDELVSRDLFGAIAQLKREVVEADKELIEAEKKYNAVVSGNDTSITVTQALLNLNAAKDKSTKKTNQLKGAEKELSDQIDQLGKEIENVGNAIGGTVGEIVSLMGSITSTVTFAIDGMKAVAATGAAAISTVEKASVILAIISAALQIATKIASLFAADYSDYNKAKEAYESYISVLDKVIEKQKELVETMTGENARNSYEYALDLIKKQEAAARELGKQRLNSGASAGSHSIGKRIQKNMSWEGKWEARQVLGDQEFERIWSGRLEGLMDLPIEQLEKLQEKAPLFWAELDGDVQNYLNSIIDSNKAIEEMNKAFQESITQVSFDSFRDSFLDTLLDMNSDAKDFANDFEKYLQKSMLNSLLKEKFDDQIRSLYNSFSKYGEDNINEAEYAALQKQKDDLVNDMIKERDKMKDLFDWTSDSDTSQSSSRGGFETMTQDQASALEGRFTGMHETMLAIKEDTSSIAAWNQPIGEKFNIDGIAVPILALNESALRIERMIEENRSIAINSYYELKDINKNTKELYQMNERLGNIEKNTKGFATKK